MATGGQAEASGAHAKREAHPAGNLLPLPRQPRVPLQGQLPSGEKEREINQTQEHLLYCDGGIFYH